MAYRTQRIDSALGAVKLTPQGGAIIPAVLTRTGVLVYQGPSGEIREYRPPEEVFNPESLASLFNAPVTREHPGGRVTPDNYRSVCRGNLIGEPVPVPESGEVKGDLSVQDSELLGDIDSGKRREVSLGYDTDVDPTPGTSPEGEKYDRIQRRIRYNHVAIVEKGRAGESVSLRLDSNGDCVVQSGSPYVHGLQGDSIMLEIEIDGVKFRVGSGMTDADTQALRAAFDRTRGRFDSVSAEVSSLKSRAETAEKALHAAAEKLSKVSRYDSEDMDILSTAARIMGEGYSVEGKTPAEVMRDCVGKQFPNISLEGKSDDYIAGMFASIPAPTADAAGEMNPEEPKADADGEPPAPSPETRADSLSKVNASLGAPPSQRGAPAPDARSEYLREQAARGRRAIGAP